MRNNMQRSISHGLGIETPVKVYNVDEKQLLFICKNLSECALKVGINMSTLVRAISNKSVNKANKLNLRLAFRLCPLENSQSQA